MFKYTIKYAGALLMTLILNAWGEDKGKDQEKKWTFDDGKAGEAPKGCTGEVGEWKAAADESAPSKPNVLAQSAKNKGQIYNVAIVDAVYKDVELSVQMKAIAGEIDQGGGLIWRAKDSKNYYLARYNPLEENFRVYKVVDGKRSQLQSADLKAVPGWHALMIVMRGDQIECHLDGKKHLEAKDDTFKEAGKIGLWTKADAQTHFDDLIAKGEEAKK